MAYDHIRIMTTVFESGVWGKLTASAIKTYTAICKYYNWQKRRSNPSIKRMAQDCGISKRSVNYAIVELIKEGLIIKKKQTNFLGYDFNSYIVVDYLLKELENLSNNTKIPLTQRVALASAINCLFPESYFSSERKGLHTNYITTNYINITNSFNQSNKKTQKNNVRQTYHNTNFLKRENGLIIEKEKDIVNDFYNKLDLNASKIKRERGYKTARDLFDEGYKEEEVKFATKWAATNLKDKINSFSLIPHIIDQALKVKKKEEYKNRLNVQQEKDLLIERRNREERLREQKYLTKIKVELSGAELASFENEARAIVETDQGVKKSPGFNMCVQMKLNDLILKKYPLE